jgi:sulfatase maturation enzyme AslB (radical SAM superfamily)
MLKEFSFTEKNFESEKEGFLNFILENNKKGIKLYSVNPIPPCIIGKENKEHSIVDYGSDDVKYVLLNGKSIILKHNIIFSPDKSIIQIEEYVSKSCLACPYYNGKKCKGLVNDLFLKEKERIMLRLGKDIYDVVKSDYQDNKLDFGSVCNANCEFCFNKNFPEEILRKIPFLSKSEIKHFLYYVSRKIWYVGVSDHVQSGELLCHPEYKEIFKLVKPHVKGCEWLATNGINLDDDLVKRLKDLDAPIALSIAALSDEDIKSICHFQKIPNYNFILKLFEKYKLDFKIFTVPLKRYIKNGKLEGFVKFITENTSAKEVEFIPPSFNKFTPKHMIDELDHDGKELLNYLCELKAKYKKITWMGKKLVDYDSLQKQIKEELKSQLSALKPIKGVKLILHSKDVGAYIKEVIADLDLNDAYTQAVSPISIGGNVSCAGMLLVNDYSHAIEEALKTNTKYDVVCIPSTSFNHFLEDISLDCPARLYDKYKIPVLIVKNY